MVTFNVNLSPESFTKLAQDLQDYANKLIQAEPDILQALADYAYERIIYYIDEKNLIRTGQLRDSFVKEISEHLAVVYTDLYYAKFVEFGTGIRGRQSDYDVSKTNVENLSYTRTYPDTYLGQPAQKFVYNAVLDLERDYETIVLNVLKRKGLI